MLDVGQDKYPESSIQIYFATLIEAELIQTATFKEVEYPFLSQLIQPVKLEIITF